MIRRFPPTITSFSINSTLGGSAAPTGTPLFCIPALSTEDIEITPEVADGPQSCVLEQVTNGVAVRMAILYLLTSGATEADTHPALEVNPRDPPMLLIKNGRVVDPASKTDATLDVLLDGEKIKEIGPAGKIAAPADAEIFDASGPDRRSRLYRYPRALARAGTGVFGNHRNRHASGGARRVHGGLLHAEYEAGRTTMLPSRGSFWIARRLPAVVVCGRLGRRRWGAKAKRLPKSGHEGSGDRGRFR